MPKNIVICSDGTGNTANKNRGTNVFKIFEAVDLRARKFRPPRDKTKVIEKQVTLYDDGVGSQSFIVFKILGGAFGWGLKRNVKQLYTELARVYKNGDNLYFFGFSRGAFTIRTLIGFVAECGIPKKSVFKNRAELNQLVDEAYKHYQRNYRSLLSRILFPEWLENFLPKGLFKRIPGFIANRLPLNDNYDLNYYYQTPPIKFVGVWDTVSAVGLPFKWATEVWNKYIYRFSFRNNNLYTGVEKACHALAIDDERQTFHPMLWNEDRTAYSNQVENGKTLHQKTDKDWENDWIEQVWFPGAHSNVGGGYPKQGMSLVSLHWMMKRAYHAGLKFFDKDWDHIRDHGNITDKLYKSRSGPAVYYRYLPRDIYKICKSYNAECQIHESLRDRISLGSEGYAPGNLPPRFYLMGDEPGTHDKFFFSNKVFRDTDPEKESPLWTRLQPYISLRRQGYYLFLFTTLIGIGIYIKNLFAIAKTKLTGESNPDCLDYWKVAWDEFSTWDLAMSFFDNFLWAGMVFAFGISLFTRLKMQGMRTKFWHQHRK